MAKLKPMETLSALLEIFGECEEREGRRGGRRGIGGDIDWRKKEDWGWVSRGSPKTIIGAQIK